MFLTVSIQTYNNAAMLNKTLKSLTRLNSLSGGDYEILIVDNNCTDSTARVINSWKSSFGRLLRTCTEKQQGLSHARNKALVEARGSIVCFIDDDVIVDPNWLRAVADTFKVYDAAVVGGRSYLIYPHSRPAWLSDEKEVLLSRLDHGPDVLVDTDRELYGLNFSVDKDIALTAGGFDDRFGRTGNSLGCGEEYDLLKRIRAMGAMAVYQPTAVVGHIVRPERLHRSWFYKRIYHGAASVERQCIAEGRASQLPRLLWRTVRSGLAGIKDVFTENLSSEQMFEKQYIVIRNMGMLSENLQWRLWSAQRTKSCQLKNTDAYETPNQCNNPAV